MFSVDLSTRECDGHVVVALRGELDLVDAADVAQCRGLKGEVMRDLTVF
jgi:hypothetical protein